MTTKPAAADTPLYLAEFPNFGALPIGRGAARPLPEGWKDTSYHNDVCPSFELDLADGYVKLFVDFEDEAERELHGSPRFRAYLSDEHGNPVRDGEYLWETDDELANHAMMMLLALRAEVQDWQDNLSGERPELDVLCGQIDDAFSLTPVTPVEDSFNELVVAQQNAMARAGCPYLAFMEEDGGSPSETLFRPYAVLGTEGDTFSIALTLEFFNRRRLIDWFEKLTRQHMVDLLRQRYVGATGSRRAHVREMLERTEATRPS